MRRLWIAFTGLALLLMPLVVQAQTKVSVGALRLTSSGPIFIAIDKGYFREQGLDVELKLFTAAAQPPLAVVSGDVDFAVTGLTASFYNLAAKGGVKIIGAQSREEPGFNLVAYMVTNDAYAKGFRSLKDFAGKSVATTTTGSTFHYSLGKLAQKYGFDINSVVLRQLNALPAMQAAFKGGQVDATLIPVNGARALEQEGAGKILGWVGDETPWQLGALFTSPKNITERRPVVEAFVRAYQKAATAYHKAFNAKNASGKIIRGEGFDDMMRIMSATMQQPPELLEVGLPYIDPMGRLLVDDIYNQLAFWQSVNLVDKSADAKSMIDLSFIKGHFNVPK
ncbi:MAG TPA: ABC transporter substrate-binding protein [Alphaproteobacteria bacterium]|nr:ABC transporter substrate-binding protein [Alphaproteobacteria bacterium]